MIASTSSCRERKISFPAVRKKEEHDFRKEYKGSILAEKFCKIERKEPKFSFRALADWLSPKKAQKSIQESSLFDTVPNEILVAILSNMDRKTALSCRRLNNRFNSVTRYVINKRALFRPISISRLVITGGRRGGVELRWVSYDIQKSSSIFLPLSVIKSCRDMSFNFKQFRIQRIVFKDVALTDALVDFLRLQFSYSDLEELHHLCLSHVDLSAANSLTLHKLLAPLSKKLEMFEISQCHGMRSDSVTDAHLAQLDALRVRRITIDGVRFATPRRRPALRVGDETLKMFAESGNFPILLLDRCMVTTKNVCDYTQEYLAQLSDAEQLSSPQVCTVKRCPLVKCNDFEQECRNRGLQFRHRRGSGTMTMYNVKHHSSNASLSLTISPPEKDEELKSDKQ